MTIQISRFAEKHLSAIVSLLNEEYNDPYEFVSFDDERVLSQIRRRDLRILVAEDNGKVLGFLGARLEERGEENIFWLGANAGPNKKSIEDLLVNEFEKNAARAGDTVSTAVDEGSSSVKDWIGRGYVLNPGWLRMSAKLDGLKPIPEVAEGTKLRSLRSEEEEKFVEVTNTGFGWKRLEAGVLATWKSEDPPFNEEWVQVAEVDERIVSAVVAKPDTEYNKYLHAQRGYLGPAATLPEFRNKHLASALTTRAMNFLFEKGITAVRLGTSEKNTSSINLLRGLGFHVDVIRKVLRKKLNKT